MTFDYLFSLSAITILQPENWFSNFQDGSNFSMTCGGIGIMPFSELIFPLCGRAVLYEEHFVSFLSFLLQKDMIRHLLFVFYKAKPSIWKRVASGKAGKMSVERWKKK